MLSTLRLRKWQLKATRDNNYYPLVLKKLAEKSRNLATALSGGLSLFCNNSEFVTRFNRIRKQNRLLHLFCRDRLELTLVCFHIFERDSKQALSSHPFNIPMRPNKRDFGVKRHRRIEFS
jgi:hypothetical protein